MYLCREHFQKDVERKAREYLRQTVLFAGSRRVLIELDGGRNSSALAYILRNTFHRRRDIVIQAVVIDEGERGAQSSKDAANVAEHLDISLQHWKTPPAPDGMASSTGSSVPREALFSAAREKEAGVIATGEDLDDAALEIFLAYLQGECAREMEDVGMHWIRPLQRIPKREVRLYALIQNLGSDTTKPSLPDQRHEMAGRQLSEFDSRHPGTNYSLLKGWERLLKPEGGSRAKPLSKDMK